MDEKKERRWNVDPNKAEVLEIFTSDERLNILKSLLKRPRRLAEISEEVKLHKSEVCLHLSLLERAKVVSSEYKVIEEPHSPSGKAARFYSIDRNILTEYISKWEKMVNPLSVKISG